MSDNYTYEMMLVNGDKSALKQIIEQQMEFIAEFGIEPIHVSMNKETQKLFGSDVLTEACGMDVYTDNRLPYGVTSVTDEAPPR